MKRFFLFALVFLTALLPSISTVKHTVSAAEESGFAVAETADVWFYAEENEESKLFCLLRTYYVKILTKGGEFCAVEYLRDNPPYKKIRGYCKTNALTFVDFVPERPYLYREITVEYVLPGASLGNGSFAGYKCDFVYYGTRYDAGQLYFYVCREGTFDYIPADEELTFDLNTDYLPEEEEKTPKGNGLSVVEIVVICLVSAAVVVIAVFVARGRKPLPERSDGDF